MKKEIWQSDQPVLSNDLEKAQGSREEAIKERLVDSFNSGIVSNSQLGAEPLPFAITINASSFDIGTGVAYDPTGERVILSDASLTYVSPFISGSTQSSGDPAVPDGNSNGPLTTTDNGIGGFTLTPQVSEGKSIPAFLGDVNYIYIDYLRTTSRIVFTLQDGTNKRLFVSADDGYHIRTVSSATLVDPTTLKPTVNSIYLGYADFRSGSGTGVSNTDSRSVFKISPDQLVGTTPNASKTDRTTTYTASQEVTIDEHVKVVGSGTITATNPHGLTTTDLGLSGKSTELHEKYFHDNGIIGDQTSLTSSLYGVINAVAGAATPPTFGIDTFKIQPLSATPTELTHVTGVTIDSSDIGVFREIYFLDSAGVLLPDGTYTVYLDSTTKDIRLAGSVGIGSSYQLAISGVRTTYTVKDVSLLSTTDFVLWDATFVGTAGPGPGVNNFSSSTDRRIFGTTGSDVLARDSASDTIVVNHSVEVLGKLFAEFANGITSNLKVETASTSTINITADMLSVQGVIASSVNLTVDIAISGAGGLETISSETVDTWYAIHIITDDRGTNVSGLLSVSSTTPTLPTGYTKFRRVGWVRNNGSSNFIGFTQIMENVIYNDPIGNLFTNPSGTVSFASYVPTGILFTDFHVWTYCTRGAAPGSSTLVDVTIRTDSGSSYLRINFGTVIGTVNGSHVGGSNSFRFRLTSSQTADIVDSTSSPFTTSLYVTGYIDHG